MKQAIQWNIYYLFYFPIKETYNSNVHTNLSIIWSSVPPAFHQKNYRQREGTSKESLTSMVWYHQKVVAFVYETLHVPILLLLWTFNNNVSNELSTTYHVPILVKSSFSSPTSNRFWQAIEDRIGKGSLQVGLQSRPPGCRPYGWTTSIFLIV